MRLEYVPEGVPECPLVRLFDLLPDDASRVVEAIYALATGEASKVAIHDWPWVEAVGGCRLTLRVGRLDAGKVRLGDRPEFACTLTPGGWDNVAGRAEPFAGPLPRGFAWLVEHGDAAWLLSTQGGW